MRINDAGLAIIKRFEKCRLEAYMPTQDDVPTIGWGHTKGVNIGDVCTQEQADAWLVEDVGDAEDAVNEINPLLTPNRFSACVSLTFNIGVRAFRLSSLAKCLREGNYERAAGEFQKWNHQGGLVLRGLTRRRWAEEELFRMPEPPQETEKLIA